MNVNQWISSLNLNQLYKWKERCVNGSCFHKKYGELTLVFIESEIEHRRQLQANGFKYSYYQPVRK